MCIARWIFKLQFDRLNSFIFLVILGLFSLILVLNGLSFKNDLDAGENFLIFSLSLTRIILTFFVIILGGGNSYYKKNGVLVLVYTRGVKRLKYHLLQTAIELLTVFLILITVSMLCFIFSFFLFKPFGIVKMFIVATLESSLYLLGYLALSSFLVTAFNNLYVLIVPFCLCFLSLNVTSDTLKTVLGFFIPVFDSTNLVLFTNHFYLVFYIALFYFGAVYLKVQKDIKY